MFINAARLSAASRVIVRLAVVSLVGACTGSKGVDDANTRADEDAQVVSDAVAAAGDTAQQPSTCEPALSVPDETVFVLELGVGVISPVGGSGEFRFELAEESNAVELNGDTGVVFADGAAGSTASIRAIDELCGDEVSVTVVVVASMRINPIDAEVPPGTTIEFAVSEGSGTFEYELISTESGGVLIGDTLTTGDAFGVDKVRIVDAFTRQEDTAIISVIDRPSLRPAARNLLLLPGETLGFSVEGGSGSLSFILDDTLVNFDQEADILQAIGLGQGQVVVSDARLSLTETLAVVVDEAVGTEGNRSGDNTDRASMLGTHDWTGDGKPDLVVGVPEMDVESFNSGVAYIYEADSEGGFLPTPTRVLSSPDKGVQIGESLTAGDFDGDGNADLAVSATFDDAGVGNGGAISVYRGLPDGGLSDAPAWVLGGAYRSDRLGMRIAACDLNADGVDDLLATTTEAENRALLQPFSSQGALFVFLGREGKGLSTTFDQAIYGHTYDGETLVQQANLRMGVSLAVGDYNGDGACDAAVGSTNLGVDLGGEQEGPIDRDGGVFLYLGEHAEAGTDGGLNAFPARVWLSDQPTDAGSEFGAALVMGDFDADGFDDLVASQPLHNTPDTSGQNHGAVRVFRGGPVPTYFGDTPLSVTDADWVFEGQYANSELGNALTTGDLNNDGVLDLVITAPEIALPNTPVRSGAVAAFYGQIEALPTLEADWVAKGIESEGRAGTSVAVLDEGVAFMVSRDNTFGLDVGRPYWRAVAEGATSQGLDVPGIGAGDRFGASVVVAGDLGGNGYADIAVGAPLEDTMALGTSAGVVQIFSGASDGFSSAPVATLSGFRSHRTGDRFGSEVHALGDFDGDGLADLGVSASGADVRSQNYYGAGWAVSGPCVFNHNNSNPLFIFRGTDAGGPQGEPAFAIFSNQKGAQITSVGVGGDVNGDGRDDVVIGVAGYDYPGEELDVEDTGAFMVYYGRPAASDGTTQVLCEPNLVYVNKTEIIETRLGSAAAIVDSVDGDSCDEVLVGADGDFALEAREGLVWFVRGWGGLDCPSAPEVAVLASHLYRAHLGSVMHSEGDYDGDGLVDLVVGNPDFVTEGLPSGGLWLVPGAHLASLATEPLGLERPETFHPLIMPGASPLLLRAIGTTGDGQFGRDVAAVPHPDDGGRDALLVGIPFGKAGGSLQSGGALVLEVRGIFGDDDYGFDPVPLARFGGESSRSGSQFGAAVGGGLLDGQPWVVIGGPEASAVTMDNGAIASFPLVR